MVMTAAEGSGDKLARAVEHAVSASQFILRRYSSHEGDTFLRAFFYGYACVLQFEALPINERSVLEIQRHNLVLPSPIPLSLRSLLLPGQRRKRQLIAPHAVILAVCVGNGRRCGNSTDLTDAFGAEWSNWIKAFHADHFKFGHVLDLG